MTIILAVYYENGYRVLVRFFFKFFQGDKIKFVGNTVLLFLTSIILTCKDYSGHLFRSNVSEILEYLDGAYLVIEARLVLLLGLSDAQDGTQTLVQHFSHFSVDGSVIVAE